MSLQGSFPDILKSWKKGKLLDRMITCGHTDGTTTGIQATHHGKELSHYV